MLSLAPAPFLFVMLFMSNRYISINQRLTTTTTTTTLNTMSLNSVNEKNAQDQQQQEPVVMMWKSKLGTEYPKEFILQNERQFQQELDTIKMQQPENQYCADCGVHDTVWASVNLGVFLCMTCGAHHRSLGTHVSKTKGCTAGTSYLWGPDEIESMRSKGNAHAKLVYGDVMPPPDLQQETHVGPWVQFLTQKYVDRKWAPKLTYVHNTLVSSPVSSPTQKNGTPLKVSRQLLSTASNNNIDLITFDHHDTQSSGIKGTTVRVSPTTSPADQYQHKPTKTILLPSSPSTTTNAKKLSDTNFFAEFGL